jgi:hypothetical protein
MSEGLVRLLFCLPPLLHRLLEPLAEGGGRGSEGCVFSSCLSSLTFILLLFVRGVEPSDGDRLRFQSNYASGDNLHRIASCTLSNDNITICMA